MHPNRVVVRAYLWRGVRLWFATRGVVTGVFLFAQVDPVRLTATGVCQLVLVSTVACLFDTMRHRERAFLGNLAVRPLSLVTLFAMPALLGELAIRLVASLLSR